MYRFLITLASLVTVGSIARPFDCGGLVAEQDIPADATLLQRGNPLRPLMQILKGHSTSYADFRATTRDLALFLLGEKTPQEMKNSAFFSPRSGKIDLDNGLQHLLDEDIRVLRLGVETEIRHQFERLTYGGKTDAESKAAIAKAPTLMVVTHQISKFQESTSRAARALGDIPVIWLVGMESSDPLTRAGVERASLVRLSAGGALHVALPQAQTVYLAGGAVEQCLTQTIQSLITHTTTKQLDIKIISELTYVDMVGGSHLSLTDFAKSSILNKEEATERAIYEMEALLEDDEVILDVEKSSTASLDVGTKLFFTAPEDREIRVEIVP